MSRRVPVVEVALLALASLVLASMSIQAEYARSHGEPYRIQSSLAPGDHFTTVLNLSTLRPGSSLGLQLNINATASGPVRLLILDSANYRRWSMNAGYNPLAEWPIYGSAGVVVNLTIGALADGIYVVALDEGGRGSAVELEFVVSWLERRYAGPLDSASVRTILVTLAIAMVTAAAWLRARRLSPLS